MIYCTLFPIDFNISKSLGTELRKVTEFGNLYTPLIDLITTRYEEQPYTIFTTNLAPAQLNEKDGKRYLGHIAMWNGRQWVSDFKQRNIIVHSDYRKEGCEDAIFRKGELNYETNTIENNCRYPCNISC